MSKRDLTKNEALELITPIVDDEVDEELRIAFFHYIEHDEVVRSKYESIKRLKDVVASRCPCAKAPPQLKKRIVSFLASSKEPAVQSELDEPIYDIPCDRSVDGAGDTTSQHNEPGSEAAEAGTTRPAAFWGNYHYWMYAAAALAAIGLLAAQYFLGGEPLPVDTYNIEEYAYTHFMRHQGKMVPPTISTASLAGAELELAESFDIAMTVPPLRNADFKGVVLSNFVDDFKTPMLEYHLPAEDQYIYIFAFKINELNRNEKLSRSREAVKSCVKSDDFHIRNVNGKHIVSWKWNDTWYAAISNHDGKTLASLVEPLNYEQAEEQPQE